MPVQWNPEGAYAKELEKWNLPKNQGGHNANGFEPYPRMLYRALKKPNGQVICMEPEPSPFGWQNEQDYARACLHAEGLTKSCQHIVHSEQEEREAIASGWSLSAKEALARFEAHEQEIARVAAEVNFAARRMSDTAQREHATATNATHEHVTDVQPKKKRGRPARGVVAVTE